MLYLRSSHTVNVAVVSAGLFPFCLSIKRTTIPNWDYTVLGETIQTG